MSDINPFTGKPSQPAPTIQAQPQERAVFEDGAKTSFEEQFESEQARKLEQLAFQASKTKFATGNSDVDIRNYLRFKSHVEGLMEFIDDQS